MMRSVWILEELAVGGLLTTWLVVSRHHSERDARRAKRAREERGGHRELRITFAVQEPPQ